MPPKHVCSCKFVFAWMRIVAATPCFCKLHKRALYKQRQPFAATTLESWQRPLSWHWHCGWVTAHMLRPTLRASLSGTFLQTLPDLVTPHKGYSLSPRSCPPTRLAPSERFGYWSHSEHRFPAPSSLKEGCRKPVFGVWVLIRLEAT